MQIRPHSACVYRRLGGGKSLVAGRGYAQRSSSVRRPPSLPFLACLIVGPVHVDADAVIEAGATVGPYAQVGRGAVIREGVAVRRCVVWDRAVVSRDSTDTVVVPA